MSADHLNDPTALVVMRLEERNRLAQKTIDSYAVNHAWMDVLVGAVGLIPGAAIPALMAAIAAQGPAIYQPMARKLGRIYQASPDDLMRAEDEFVASGIVTTGMIDIAADFGGEFLVEIAKEIVVEVGFGVVLTFIPFFGALAAAGLDAVIATKMTHRIGRMVATYFQNGGRWIDSRRNTYELAKEMTGDLNTIRHRVGAVRETLLRNVRAMVDMMKAAMTKDQIRQTLKDKEIPSDLIDEVLGAA